MAGARLLVVWPAGKAPGVQLITNQQLPENSLVKTARLFSVSCYVSRSSTSGEKGDFGASTGQEVGGGEEGTPTSPPQPRPGTASRLAYRFASRRCRSFNSWLQPWLKSLFCYTKKG